VDFGGPGFLQENGPQVSFLGATVYGLAFTVSGSVTEGGIGVFETKTDLTTGRPKQDIVNPHGNWTVQQWTNNTSSFTYDTGTTYPPHYSPTHPDAANEDFRRVEGNGFVYADVPGPRLAVNGDGILKSYDGDWNFDIKLIRGDQQCEVRFSVKMQLRNAHFQAFWR
jgi:hypothetical protein